MRLPFFIVSCVLHVIVLTWLYLHVPNVPKLVTEPETQIELTPQSPASPQVSSTESVAKTSQSASQNPANSIATPDVPPVSSVPNSNTSASNQINQTTTTTQPQSAQNGVQANSKNSSSNAPSSSNSPPTPSKAPASTAAQLNRPKTSELICSSTAKKQGVHGKVVVNVQMDTLGHVKSASVANSSDDIMKESALVQAKQLQFPIMRNADNVAVESYANVLFTFDCSSN